MGMRVRELMTADVVTVRTDTAVNDVARLMSKHGISGIPVLDARGRLAGIITELDLIVRNGRLEMPAFLQVFDAIVPLELPGHVQERLRHMLGTHAEDVMTRDVHSVGPEAEIEDLVALMTKKRVNPVPVMDQDTLVGIVSRSDLVRMMAMDLGTT
jgi:CBS-domain-containing membrane protein